MLVGGVTLVDAETPGALTVPIFPCRPVSLPLISPACLLPLRNKLFIHAQSLHMIAPLTEKLASDDKLIALYINKTLYIPPQTKVFFAALSTSTKLYETHSA